MTAEVIAGVGKEAPIETTSARFRADVLEASLRRPVLVDFRALGRSHEFAPILERMVAAAQGKVGLVTMNIDEYPDIAEQLGIESIPAVVAFQRGRPVDGFVGALSESAIRGFIERLVGPIDDPLDVFSAAAALIDDGDLAGAEALLTELAGQEPPHAEAIAELARLYIATDRLDEARALLDSLPESIRRGPAAAASVAALENAERAQELGEIDELRQRAAVHPNDHQAGFDLALALNAKGKRDDAAAALLDIIRKDRSWNDDGARRQLLQFFEAWGPMDPAAIAARRRLSALLFS